MFTADAYNVSIRRNTAYNLIGAVVPLAVSLVTIPMYLSFIGEERYGVLAIAWLLLGYFGLFDLGLGRATAQHIAALRDGFAEERAETFWTALSMNLGLGIIGGLALWPIAGYFFGQVFKIDDVLRAELLAAVPWLMLALPMATVSGVLTGALQGRERFLELNFISVSGTTLFQLLPLAVAASGHVNLGVLLPAALFARLLTVLFLAWRCWADVTRDQPFRFETSLAASLLRFGGWVTVTAFVGPMMVILDRFIISATVGAKAVTYYTVPFNLAERSSLLSGALTSALFPRFAALGREDEKQLAQEGLRVLVVVMTPLTVLAVLLIEPFLDWWISPELAARSSLVGQIILLGFWFNSFARIPHAQLQARGRPDIVAKCHLAELLPYFALLYLGLYFAGLPGAALAFSLRVAVDYLLLAGFARTLHSSLVQLVPPGVLVATSLLIATSSTLGSVTWVIVAAIQLGLTLLWAWWKAPPALKHPSLSAVGFGNNSGSPPSIRTKV